MAVNLLRNSRVFYTNITKAQAVGGAAITTSNTWELLPMSDFTFSQGTEQQTITLNEAGATPSRGQRSFNTAINPVDWSFGTYIRPVRLNDGTDPDITCAPELLLWNALASSTSIPEGDYVIGNGGFSKHVATATANGVTTGTAYQLTPDASAGTAVVDFAKSNTHSFVEFGLIFEVDGTTYYLDKCSVNQADINFGIDQIASVAWSGQARGLVPLSAANIGQLNTVADYSAGWEEALQAHFLTNKLASVSLVGTDINGQPGATTYNLALTGGQLTINNNINYLTPELLGVVNAPIGYYSGTRAISGNMTAYLKTDNLSTGKLLTDLAGHSTNDSDNKFALTINIGGAKGLTSTNPHFILTMPMAVLQIPTIDVQDVISTTINFTAQASTGANYDIGATNELTITYATSTT